MFRQAKFQASLRECNNRIKQKRIGEITYLKNKILILQNSSIPVTLFLKENTISMTEKNRNEIQEYMKEARDKNYKLKDRNEMLKMTLEVATEGLTVATLRIAQQEENISALLQLANMASQEQIHENSLKKVNLEKLKIAK